VDAKSLSERYDALGMADRLGRYPRSIQYIFLRGQQHQSTTTMSVIAGMLWDFSVQQNVLHLGHMQ